MEEIAIEKVHDFHSNLASFINLLDEYSIVTNKKYGQNFIWDLDLLDKFIHKANILPLDNVLEIGAGTGTFSYVLSKYANNVIALEIDDNLKPILNKVSIQANNDFGSNLEFKFVNALDFNWQSLFDSNQMKNISLIGNLPYYLTTELITKAILDFHLANNMLLLVEDKVVPRLVGQAGDGKSANTNSGFLYKLISCYGNINSLLTVKASHFFPKPRVNSKLIILRANTDSYSYKILSQYPNELCKVIKISFLQRRKTLANCFANIGLKNEIHDWLELMSYPINIRAEQLEANDFAKLCIFLMDKLNDIDDVSFK